MLQSLLIEIILAISGIENAPESLTTTERIQEVNLRFCAPLPKPQNLDCLIEVIEAYAPTEEKKPTKGSK